MQEVRLIDAKAVEGELIREAGSIKAKNRFDKGEIWGFELAAKMVSRFPPIDPETLRPVAHWENDPDGMDSDIFSCSNCCERICLEDQGFFPKMDYKFCPYCGARMEEL